MTKRRPRSRARRPSDGNAIEIGGAALAAGLLFVVAVVAGAWWWLDGDRSGRVSAPSAPLVHEPGTGYTTDFDPVVGMATAPVTIVEYSDYQCPNCREFATDVLPWMRETWVAGGFVRVIFRDFAIRGDGSFRAAEAAHCAGDQGRFWSYHDALFGAPAGGATTDEQLLELSDAAGVDRDRLADCLADGRHRARVEASTEAALGLGLEGTPTFLVNGRTVAGAVAADEWEQLFQLYQRDFAQATQNAEGN